ncbi:hypothetical protein TUMEXPCC7403_15125 [Tumidithrix helvetica PCC 7403]|uniref:SAV_2336 N-terminal domain-related protein n=1 Tax=Tumidithrix helvetica TaxID=3457545 RepID=UPI003CB4E956
MNETLAPAIAEVLTLLRDRAKLEVTATELAEILWLAMHLEPQEVSYLPSVISPAAPPSESFSENRESTTSKSQSPIPVATQPPQDKSSQQKSQTSNSPSLPIQIPDASPLPKGLEIMRSLRPLMKKVRSTRLFTLDEEATAILRAETKSWIPVMRPELERWLDLAFVVEKTNLEEVWKDPIAAFLYRVERSGVFRNVRFWHLSARPDAPPQLFLQTAMGKKSHPRSPKELLDPSGRCLVMFASDCTSTGWRSGKVPDLLKQWTTKNPVTVVQLLPERYWERSVLGFGYFVWLRSRSSEPLSDRFLVEGLPPSERHLLHDPNRHNPDRMAIVLPVVTIEPEPLKQWAQVMAAGEQETAGVVLDLSLLKDYVAADSAVKPTALQTVRLFWSTASPLARKLAPTIAAVGASMSVIRLIQKNFPEFSTLHVAEVFLSGLLCRQENGGYRCDREVKDLLLGSMPRSQTHEAVEKIGNQLYENLPKDVKDRISADIERRFGEARRNFKAFLVPNLSWGDYPNREVLTFAEIARDTLRLMGGEAAAFVEKLDRFPELFENEFEVAKIEVVESEFLELFQYQSAKIRVIESEGSRGVFGLGAKPKKQKIEIIKENREGQQFVEQIDRDCTLEMVYIPSGEFLMGSAEDEEGSYSWERPQHKVTVPAFFMGKYPITQAQYVAIMGKNPSHFKDKPDSNRRPVENISWDDANNFCQKLSEKTGRKYRLPSEAEWEYACRAMTSPPAPQLKGEGSKRVYPPFHYGETISTKVANYNGEIYGRGEKGEYRQETTPVDYFGVANDFGLCDMHGNVWEWCLDTWHDNYEGAPTDGSAWIELNKTSHIRRGGSWSSYPRFCRSAFRFHLILDFRDLNFGFRVVALPPGLF